MKAETIAAISTPPGRGGIGIVRLSGADARTIAEPLLKLRSPLAHAAARFGLVLSEAGEKLDEIVATFFAAPHSYTGEDVLEIAAHGSPVVLGNILQQLLMRGARLARPGEFTERAFLGGRIDLTQAEAVRDLIEAQTVSQARLAAEQMGGALSRKIAPIKHRLVSLIAGLEAGIDFAEDDVDVMPAAAISAEIAAIQQQIQQVADTYQHGRLLHSGINLAIIGAPNVGKSSLFNRLVERDRAIVTPIPGTTRDLVTETVSLGGIPVHLTDTAGLRNTTDIAESIGIEKTREAIADADIVLIVSDISSRPRDASADMELVSRVGERPALFVWNKIDLISGQEIISLEAPLPQVAVSAQSGEGISELRKKILERLQGSGVQESAGLLTSARHFEAMLRCQQALRQASAAVGEGMPHEMLLLDLYQALESLDALTGATTADDILNLIFSTFCIGK